jgi:glutamate formiminotransferase
MPSLFECVPNFSEGRRQEIIDAIAAALRAPGVLLLDVHADPDHNRSVFTLVGPPDALLEAVYAGIVAATRLIDLRQHSGVHPRVGAADVVPFVPLHDASMEQAVELAHRLGERVARELDLPVYFYEAAATRPERQNLEQVRRKGFEELRDVIATDPTRLPDVGPPRVHPSAGAIIIGARGPLIAYNIYLSTSNLAIAQTIARTIRHSSGGLRYVKAMGFAIPERNCVQVSMNLTNYRRTAIHTVFEMVRTLAESYGVTITASEVVGLVPAAALFDVARHYLRAHDLRNSQVLEMRLLEQTGFGSATEILEPHTITSNGTIEGETDAYRNAEMDSAS